jgi:hypothetical protein
MELQVNSSRAQQPGSKNAKGESRSPRRQSKFPQRQDLDAEVGFFGRPTTVSTSVATTISVRVKRALSETRALRPGVAAGLPLSVELQFVKPPDFFRHLLGQALTLTALSTSCRQQSSCQVIFSATNTQHLD